VSLWLVLGIVAVAGYLCCLGRVDTSVRPVASGALLMHCHACGLSGAGISATATKFTKKKMTAEETQLLLSSMAAMVRALPTLTPDPATAYPSHNPQRLKGDCSAFNYTPATPCEQCIYHHV